jgi:hypothetical protein
MGSLWSDPDFMKNVYAGALFFILEIVLLVGLVPWLVDRRLEARWKPSRLQLCVDARRSIFRAVAVVDGLATHWSTSTKAEAEERLKNLQFEVGQVVQTYSAALNADLMRLCAKLIQRNAGVQTTLRLMLSMPESDTLEKIATRGFNECEEVLREMYAQVGAPTPKAVLSKDEVQRFAKQVARLRQAARGGQAAPG